MAAETRPRARPGTSILHSMRRCSAALLLALPFAAFPAEQQTFANPNEAVNALLAALKANDDKALLALFGETHKELVMSRDRAADAANRANAAAQIETYRFLQEQGKDRRILLIGDQAWPVPIPIVKSGERWRFATEEGEDELINRRIGANERNAIQVMHAYLEAQKQYASADRNGDGVLEYARRLGSTPGKKDGLYWPADPAKGEEISPFGPLVAESAPYFKGRKAGAPYRGYRYRILTRQGKHAPGGAYNYIINGRMLPGFALVAYPDQYGESGVMSFIVNQNGKVFEKDLGRNTAAIGARMNSFDPGRGWREVVL